MTVSTISFCWTVERRDGAGLALTSHDAALQWGGVSYRPEPGFDPSAATAGDLDEAAGELRGAVSVGSLTSGDLRAGRWDGARVTLSALDWTGEAQEVTSLCSGRLGEVSFDTGSFRADLLGAAERLKGPVVPQTSPECRARLGDKRCGVNLVSRRFRARVVSLDGQRLLLDREAGAAFARGMLRWLRGANCGSSVRILRSTGMEIVLQEPPAMACHAGEWVLLTEGCDKRLSTCRDRFGNTENFRGEPHLPGNDLLTRYPGS